MESLTVNLLRIARMLIETRLNIQVTEIFFEDGSGRNFMYKTVTNSNYSFIRL